MKNYRFIGMTDRTARVDSVFVAERPYDEDDTGAQIELVRDGLPVELDEDQVRRLQETGVNLEEVTKTEAKAEKKSAANQSSNAPAQA